MLNDVQTKNQKVDDKTVIEHNDLITGITEMDKVPLQVFEMIVAHIDVDNPPKKNLIKLSKKDVFNLFQAKDKNRYKRFRDIFSKIHQLTIYVVNKRGKKEDYKLISPIVMTNWGNYSNTIEIYLSDAVMPYLINLKRNFTQYALSDIMKLNSKHSIVIYKWLCMNFNQYKYYSDSNNRTDKQIEDYQNPYITIKELRRLTNTSDRYKLMVNFTKNVLDIAVDDISKNTHLIVKYKKIKKGKSIAGVKFFVEEKKIAPNDYKSTDEAYLKDKKIKLQEEQKLFSKAVQSRYTPMLLKNFLLTGYDMTDSAIMITLEKHVYPKYDEIVSLKGIVNLDKHMKYVFDKQKEFSKKNIGRYLSKSADDYLLRLKISSTE